MALVARPRQLDLHARWAAAAALIGGLGMLRLPDVFARMHGAGMIDTLGLGADPGSGS